MSSLNPEPEALSSGISSSSSPVGSDAGYASGARTPQPGREGIALVDAAPGSSTNNNNNSSSNSSSSNTTMAGASGSLRASSARQQQHQRKRSSVIIPVNLTTRVAPRKLLPEPPDNTLNPTTRQEFSWEEPSPLDDLHSPAAEGAGLAEGIAISSHSSSSSSAHSRPSSVAQGRPSARRRGTLGYVVSSSSHSLNGQLPDSAASSLSSHHSSPRTPSVYGGSVRERQRTNSGWTSSSSDHFVARSSIAMTPGSASGSPIPPAASPVPRLPAAVDRPVEDGTTLLTVHKDLLSAIASKQRTCAELRQELEREEAELRELQRLWEARVQQEYAAQHGGPGASPGAAAAESLGAKAGSRSKAVLAGPSIAVPLGAGASIVSATKRPSLGTLAISPHANDASSSSSSAGGPSSATDTFKKLLGNWGLSTPSLSTPSTTKQSGGSSAPSSSSYFPLPSSATRLDARGKTRGTASASSSGGSSPYAGTPLEGLSDSEEADFIAHFQPKDLDKEREEQERKQRVEKENGHKQGPVNIIPPEEARQSSISITPSSSSPSTLAGQSLERSGTKTPTPATIDAIIETRDGELTPLHLASQGRKGSLASEGSEVHTPKVNSSAQMFNGEAEATPTPVALSAAVAVSVPDKDRAAKAMAAAAEGARTGTGLGRKTGGSLGGESVLFPRRSGETTAASSSGSGSSARDSSASTSSSSLPSSTATSSSSAAAARDIAQSSSKAGAGAGAGPRSPSAASFPAWGVKRFSMLGESISAFSAKVEEQFAAAAAAAAATASASPPPPPPKHGDAFFPERKMRSSVVTTAAEQSRPSAADGERPKGAGMQRIGSNAGTGSGGERISQDSSADSLGSGSGSGSSGLTSSLSAWSTKRLKEAGEFLANAERTIGNALVLDDPSPPSGGPVRNAGAATRRVSGSFPSSGAASTEQRRTSTDVGRPGSPEWYRNRLASAQQNGAGPAADGGPVQAERSRFETEADREREALRQLGRRAQSPAQHQHQRSASIVSSNGGVAGDAASSNSTSSHQHRRSLSLGLSRPSSILSSAEAGVSSLFGMLSNALTVPPEDEEEDAEREREREWDREVERRQQQQQQQQQRRPDGTGRDARSKEE
ncbi:hypothetical protein OC835_004525 [Tilletia horrida]|nr:hypothetical protein OC835_004525 [Tilletia horrida]